VSAVTKNHRVWPESRRSKNRLPGGRLGDRFRRSTDRSLQTAILEYKPIRV